MLPYCKSLLTGDNMLKILLGGIAGVATGYALKKYLDEEECANTYYDDEDDESFNSNTTLDEEMVDTLIARLDELKNKLNLTLFRDTTTLLRSIKNLHPGVAHLYLDSMEGLNLLSDTSQHREKLIEFYETLCEVEKAQYIHLSELEEAFLNTDDVEQLSKEDQIKANLFIEIDAFMRVACKAPLSYDGEEMTMVVKMVFHKLSMFITKTTNSN